MRLGWSVSTIACFRAKYFRGKRLDGDWDIKVDQVEFKDLSVSASSSGGVTANIKSYKSGTANIRLAQINISLNSLLTQPS